MRTRRRSRFLAAVPLGLSLAVCLVAASPQRAPQTLTADALFQTSKIWSVHLTMTKKAWDALTPVPAPVRSAGPGFVGPQGKRNGISAQKGLDFQYEHATLDVDTQHFADVAVRFKGNGTYTPVQRFGKPSLKIDLNKYVKGQKLAGLSTINLHNNITDASWMNEVLAFRLYRDAGVPAPRTSYARVYVTVPGSPPNRYLGLYSVVENVDTTFAADRFGVSGGALFKPVTTNPFADVGKNWSAYAQMYDAKRDLTPAESQRMIDFCTLVSHATDQDFAARLPQFIDLGAFAKYMAVVVWIANPDSVLQQGQNYYVHMHPKTRAFEFVPWDQDHSFGQFVPFRSPESQQTLDILHPWSQSPAMGFAGADINRAFLARTFGVEAFKRPYLAALAALARTLTLPDRLFKQVDELGALLGPVVAMEPPSERVDAFKAALGEAPFKRPINQSVTVVPIRTFVRNRQASVVAQLQKLGIK